ncbi:tripartite tricarboxylate transporter substrate binding protein [Bradyrhizobium sp. CB3481]|uniref:Bug family tripartite tricarboxylate transporter substrate binding protein n=1 Tax=Bradyrhizobium sp. CB3481 TaxID=3039158 RepID=UPI0024B170B5|nr:tripartite tricarboxylate transporter substrate binding protein [Bradyrhizobium sp. CB3481]WFU19123.1 tripartite tricarboxylate transporter substrate binding protein [Bradyrhizobium sp. CB3481]
MHRFDRRSILLGLALTPLGAAADQAWAQEYPQRPVRVIVPYAAGGASDIVARLVTSYMAKELGQMFVDNRGGGASITGTQAIATSQPDGYTVGVIDTAFTINPGLFGARLPYNTQNDFALVSLFARSSLVLVVPASLPVNGLQDLVALARAKPGTVTMASAGLGTAIHLACEQFRQAAGIETIHVPYRGGGPSIIDLLAGKVDFTFGTIPAILEHVRSGQLKALGITTGGVDVLPGVPTMAESGLPNVDAAAEFGMIAPARIPEPIMTRLSTVAQNVLQMPELRRRMTEIGFEAVGMAPKEYSAHIEGEIAKWTRVIAAGNIKAE